MMVLLCLELIAAMSTAMPMIIVAVILNPYRFPNFLPYRYLIKGYNFSNEILNDQYSNLTWISVHAGTLTDSFFHTSFFSVAHFFSFTTLKIVIFSVFHSCSFFLTQICFLTGFQTWTHSSFHSNFFSLRHTEMVL